MTIRKSRLFFGVAVVAVSVLALLPSTSWIVRQQANMIVGRAMPGLDGPIANFHVIPDAREAAIAAAHSDDFERQLALVVQRTSFSDPEAPKGISSTLAPALLALRPKFDDHPALQATILRNLSLFDLKTGRNGETILLYTPKVQEERAKAEAQYPSKPPTVEAIALAESTARRGEALDPNNGFFSAMDAIALFAERRDDEALNALDAASQKPKWNDYSTEEIRATWSLLAEARGETSALPRMFLAGNVMYFHLPRLREMAQLSVELAVRREMEGDTASGDRIRHAVARLGARLRANSPSLAGNEVGAKIVGLVTCRPCGAPALDTTPDGFATAEARDRYIAYLTILGNPDEARWFRAESKADDTVHKIFGDTYSAEENSYDTSFGRATHLTEWWAAGVAVLMAALWTLALGAVATFVARRQSTPAMPVRQSDRTAKGIVRAILRGIAGLAMTLVAGAGLTAAISLSCAGAGLSYSRSLYFVLGTAINLSFVPAAITIGMLASLISVLVLITLIVYSCVRRIPVRVGVARGLRGIALPLAGGLLLIYAGVVVRTRVEETRVQTAIQATLLNEGKYQAGLSHQAWPGPVVVSSESDK